MTKPRIGIIISTTRETRFGHRPAEWIQRIGNGRGDAEYELVDLRDYPLPLFDAPLSPAFAAIDHDIARLWAAKMTELDGYIFVTAEYNRSITGALKNALDHVYNEPKRKPAAFVGYGGVGGARAVEQLRLMLIELQMAPTRNAVHIAADPYLGVLKEGKDFSDYDFLVASANTMLDELGWWTRVLKAGRQQEELQQAA
jgi:NAD(P)H-dependent FMN reductase